MQPGEVEICWLNAYSTIRVATAQATLIFDPVLVDANDHGRPDAVVVSHDHQDHFDRRTLQQYLNLGVPVFGPPFIADVCKGVRPMRLDDEMRFGDLTLCTVGCDHPACEPLSFVVTAASGSIYHPVDSDPFDEMRSIAARHQPRVMLFSNGSIEKLLDIVDLTHPEIVLGFHYDRHWAADLTRRFEVHCQGSRLRLLRRLEGYRL